MISSLFVTVSEFFIILVLVMASLTIKPPVCLVLDIPNVAANWKRGFVAGKFAGP